MRWLISALLSVALITLAVIFAGGDRTDGATSRDPAEAPAIEERAAALDTRLLEIGTRSRELAGYFSETGIGEQLGVLDSRLRAIKVGIVQVQEAAADQDPLVRDTAERRLAQLSESLAEQERRFEAFDALFERMRPQFINAFGRLGRINAILQHLIELGAPCQNEQATTREISESYRNGRRFLVGELSKVLDGDEPDDTILALAASALQSTFDDLQPLYEKLQPVEIELRRIESQAMTITRRLEWARGVRDALKDDPWLATPEADLEARGREWDELEQRAEALRGDALAENFIAEARTLVQDMTTLLQAINVYVNKARQAELPLPR